MPDTVPKISIDTAFEICRDALANGMKLPPIIEKYGAPHFYNNLPSKKSASWPLASNAMDIRSFQVFYNKSGELTQVALFGQDFNLWLALCTGWMKTNIVYSALNMKVARDHARDFSFLLGPHSNIQFLNKLRVLLNILIP